MSGFTRFVVAGGSGGLGVFIVEELAALKNIRTTVLSRSATADVPSNVEVKAVDYSNEADLEAALKGADVVISTLNGQGFASQVPLAQAAKNAGVKLFVPSEFGNPTDKLDQASPLYAKKQLHQLLEKIKLPYVLTFTGPFPDFVFIPLIGFNLDKSEATLVGKGDTPISFTARSDIASFLVHALTTFPVSELENKILRIEGDRKTFNQALDSYEKTHPGKTIKRTYTPISETKAYIESHPGHASVIQWLILSWELGATVDQGEKLSNDLWKNWKPKSVEQILAEQA